MERRNDDQPIPSIADVARVRGLLIDAAAARRSTSYADLLAKLGHRFTRPKMRALCKTLNAIDAAARTVDEPDLAVLVVRESDALPGQGWWVANATSLGYDGAWTGRTAKRFVQQRQALAFDYWARRRVSTADRASPT
jgi:hypothetical protein